MKTSILVLAMIMGACAVDEAPTSDRQCTGDSCPISEEFRQRAVDFYASELVAGGMSVNAARSTADQAMQIPPQLDASAHEMQIDLVNGGAKPNTTCIYGGDCLAFNPTDEEQRNALCRTGCQGPAICVINSRPGALVPGNDYCWNQAHECIAGGFCDSRCFQGRCTRTSGEP